MFKVFLGFVLALAVAIVIRVVYDMGRRTEALASSQGQQIIEKIRAEAQLELAKKWNGQMPVNMYSGSPFPIIDIPNQ